MAFTGNLYYDIVLMIHIMGAILGMGGATIIDYLHLRGLGSHKLEKKLLSVYPMIGNIINVGMGILIVTGIWLLWVNTQILENPLFILKLCLVGILLINGVLLNIYVFPLVKKNIQKEHPQKPTKKLILKTSVLGSISIITWYTVFTMWYLRTYVSVKSVIITYIILIILSCIVSYKFQTKSHLIKK